jgi:hypothetical protein
MQKYRHLLEKIVVFQINFVNICKKNLDPQHWSAGTGIIAT